MYHMLCTPGFSQFILACISYILLSVQILFWLPILPFFRDYEAVINFFQILYFSLHFYFLSFHTCIAGFVVLHLFYPILKLFTRCANTFLSHCIWIKLLRSNTDDAGSGFHRADCNPGMIWNIRSVPDGALRRAVTGNRNRLTSFRLSTH